MNRIQIKARGFIFDALTDGPEKGPLLILLHGLIKHHHKGWDIVQSNHILVEKQ